MVEEQLEASIDNAKRAGAQESDLKAKDALVHVHKVRTAIDQVGKLLSPRMHPVTEADLSSKLQAALQTAEANSRLDEQAANYTVCKQSLDRHLAPARSSSEWSRRSIMLAV